MNAEILSVGSELVLGRIADTNAAYLSQKLATLGVDVIYHTAVGDDRDLLGRALETASERADLVIMTGGLGPTLDDLTRGVAAEVCGVGLCKDEAAAEHIGEIFKRYGRKMPPSNVGQAEIPEGSEPIPNERGTAVGFAVRLNRAEIMALPGVPREMKLMYEGWIEPRLRKQLAGGPMLYIRQLNTFGLPESGLGERIADLMAPGRNPAVGTQATAGVIKVRLTARADDEAAARALLDRDEATVRERLGEAVFGTDSDTLAHAAARLLEQGRLTLAVAESCTGGLVCDMLTDVPGISRFLLEGLVAYSNESKTARLGVPERLFQQVGAVSPEVAAAMARGARERTRADLAVSTTGIAGPTGGSALKPVGLVHMALAHERGVDHKEYRTRGSRQEIKDRAAKAALNMLRLHLIGGQGT